MGSDDVQKTDEEFTEDVPTIELDVATGGSAPSKSVPTQGGGGDSASSGTIDESTGTQTPSE